LEVKLAGFNVETTLLNSLKEENKNRFTPEIFSAAYARISRSSLSVTDLREKAREDIQKARASNKKIIFSMGHHSVAEHAVFNFDIIGVSRLALEDIEKFRLSSFTEKSQRYVTLKGDFHTPSEISDPALRREFKKMISEQNNFYVAAFEKLKDHLYKKHPELLKNRSDKSMVTGWAKEDARYILSLATLGQVGLTINARNLEHLFRRFAMSPKSETVEIGNALYNEVKNIAPSIILFRNPSQFERDIINLRDEFKLDKTIKKIKDFKIVDFTPDGDDLILSSFYSQYNAVDFSKSRSLVKKLSDKRKKELFFKLFRNMEFFDTPPRNFELPEITFEAAISASNFAQLKRHRIATLISGSYDPDLGNTIPQSLIDVGLENKFIEIIAGTNEIYYKLNKKYDGIGDYIITNSHRRNVLMKMNLRELFHFIRLRSDSHAQWDIKNISNNLLVQIKKIMPFASMLLCGKDSFVKEFENIYGKKPDFLI